MTDSERLPDDTGTIPVVVTTEHRGVFFGTIQAAHRDRLTLDLADAQMCVYWAESVRGVMGLAVTGPDDRCKVSRPVPSMTVHKVTAVMEATQEAAAAWRTRPWS